MDIFRYQTATLTRTTGSQRHLVERTPQGPQTVDNPGQGTSHRFQLRQLVSRKQVGVSQTPSFQAAGKQRWQRDLFAVQSR
jgi:hypothetical protein